MGDYALNVEVRDGSGKGVARRLRQAGRIPGICYGRGMESVSVALDPRALQDLIASSETGFNTLIDLKVAGGGELDGKVVLVREIQRDPVGSHYLHADLYALDLSEKIEVSVPVHLTGHARGVELEGGIVDHALREVVVQCFPRAIPGEIPVDVSELDVGDSIHVRELILPGDVELVSDGDLSVVSVVMPAAVEEETPAEEAAVEGAEGAEGEGVPAEGEDGEKGEPAAEGDEKSDD